MKDMPEQDDDDRIHRLGKLSDKYQEETDVIAKYLIEAFLMLNTVTKIHCDVLESLTSKLAIM